MTNNLRPESARNLTSEMIRPQRERERGGENTQSTCWMDNVQGELHRDGVLHTFVLISFLLGQLTLRKHEF